MDWQLQTSGPGGTFYTGPNGTRPSCMLLEDGVTVCVTTTNPTPPPDLMCGSGTIDWGHVPIPRGGLLYQDLTAHKRTGRCFCAQGYFDSGLQSWAPALMIAQMAGPHVSYPAYGRYPENAVMDHSIWGSGAAYRLWPGSWSSLGGVDMGDLVEIYWNESADPQPPRSGRPGTDIPAGYCRTYKSADGGTTWTQNAEAALGFVPEVAGMYLGSIDNATHSGVCVFGDFEFWIYDDNYPEISIITPFDGQTTVNPSAWVEFDVMDGDYPLVDAATAVTINGVTAWTADAPAAGFSGSRTAISGGNHFILYRPWLDKEAVTVVVHVEDTLGHADDETWSFTALADLPTCVWGGGQYGELDPPYGLCLEHPPGEPTIINELPPDGSRWNPPRPWVEFDAVEGGMAIAAVQTKVTIGGIVAWQDGYPAAGFSGSCTPTTTGYHYRVRPTSWQHPTSPTEVTAEIADTGGWPASKTWLYAEWGADGVLSLGGWASPSESGRSEEYRRLIDTLLPPGAFTDEP